MTRRVLLWATLALLLVPAWLIAGNALEEYGLDPTQVENSVLGAYRGWYDPPDISRTLRALPPEQRAAAVTALGGFVKSYVQGDQFRTDYGKAYKNSKPKRGFGLPRLDVGGLVDKGVDKAMGTEKPKEPAAMDKDPNVTLRGRLREFLDTTADVDFEAATQGANRTGRFADDKYEAKPPQWKMCYRAGKEATDAARGFAKQWLEELAPAKK